MKRFRRWLFNGLVALSLVLCAATVGGWIRSYWRHDEIPFLAKPQATYFFGDWRGRVELTRQYVSPAVPSGWGTTTSNYGAVGTFRQGGGSGGASCDPHLVAPGAFYFAHTIDLGNTTISFFRLAPVQISKGIEVWAVPFWLIALLLAGYPIVVASRKLYAARRSNHGLCHSCGYDLRATPDRCPECGTIPTKKEIAST
jgi:hypothetical protein